MLGRSSVERNVSTCASVAACRSCRTRRTATMGGAAGRIRRSRTCAVSSRSISEPTGSFSSCTARSSNRMSPAGSSETPRPATAPAAPFATAWSWAATTRQPTPSTPERTGNWQNSYRHGVRADQGAPRVPVAVGVPISGLPVERESLSGGRTTAPRAIRRWRTGPPPPAWDDRNVVGVVWLRYVRRPHCVVERCEARTVAVSGGIMDPVGDARVSATPVMRHPRCRVDVARRRGDRRARCDRLVHQRGQGPRPGVGVNGDA